MSIFVDLTEFFLRMARSGIQRVGGEICRYAPRGECIPVKHDGRGYVTLPQPLIAEIAAFFKNGGQHNAEFIRRHSSDVIGPATLGENDCLLIPEVFGPDRAAAFDQMSPEEFDRCRFVVYDLLPITHPEFFPWDFQPHMAHYYRIVRRAKHCAFISERTRNLYYGRLRRTSDREGIVLGLGSDSLGPREISPKLDRKLIFSVLGTIEPRKQHSLVLDAFEPLLPQIDGLELRFVGKLGWADHSLIGRVLGLASNPNSGFRFISAPDDGIIQECIRESRATIYVSAAEGYGLPPVESLWLGTPAIVSDGSPSVNGLSYGLHFVQPLDAMNLRKAVLRFLDDRYANEKVEETRLAPLTTWAHMAQDVFRWCQPEAVNPFQHPLQYI